MLPSLSMTGSGVGWGGCFGVSIGAQKQDWINDLPTNVTPEIGHVVSLRGVGVVVREVMICFKCVSCLFRER